MTTTTDKQATTEHLIRALYAAKAEFKDAASELATAEHNLKSVKADPSANSEQRVDAATVRANASGRYYEAEQAYNVIAAACKKLAII